MFGYLPKEETNLPAGLPKTLLRSVWSNNVVNTSIGVNNEMEAREWFRNHPQVHAHFQQMNAELIAHIKHLQDRARRGLQQLVVEEQANASSFGQLPVSVLGRKRTKTEPEPDL